MFIDYAPESATEIFSLDTSGDTAVIQCYRDVSHNNIAELDRDEARELGTTLIAWTHSGLTEGTHNWEVGHSLLTLDCVDSIATITVHEEGELEAGFELAYEQAVDMGQRLIAWAGVNLRESADA